MGAQKENEKSAETNLKFTEDGDNTTELQPAVMKKLWEIREDSGRQSGALREKTSEWK